MRTRTRPAEACGPTRATISFYAFYAPNWPPPPAFLPNRPGRNTGLRPRRTLPLHFECGPEVGTASIDRESVIKRDYTRDAESFHDRKGCAINK